MGIEQQEPEEVRIRVSEADFLIYLKHLEDGWGSRLKRSINALNDIYHTRNSFFEAKRNGLQVRFFQDDEGRMWFEAGEKPKLGFLKEEE